MDYEITKYLLIYPSNLNNTREYNMTNINNTTAIEIVLSFMAEYDFTITVDGTSFIITHDEIITYVEMSAVWIAKRGFDKACDRAIELARNNAICIDSVGEQDVHTMIEILSRTKPTTTTRENNMTNTTTTYLINSVEMTELQHAFVARCLFNNYKMNGETSQHKYYTQHLVEVCIDLVRDNYSDYAAFECEEDSYDRAVEIEDLEDHEVEALYIGWAITREEFLTKYTDVSASFRQQAPKPFEGDIAGYQDNYNVLPEDEAAQMLEEFEEFIAQEHFGDFDDMFPIIKQPQEEIMILPTTIEELATIDGKMGFENLSEDELIELQGVCIANTESGTWEHTDELQVLFDRMSNILDVVNQDDSDYDEHDDAELRADEAYVASCKATGRIY